MVVPVLVDGGGGELGTRCCRYCCAADAKSLIHGTIQLSKAALSVAGIDRNRADRFMMIPASSSHLLDGLHSSNHSRVAGASHTQPGKSNSRLQSHW